MLFIKESYVYDLPGREMHCVSDDCGYWRGNNGDHSMGDFPLLKMFKVNGEYRCQGCLEDCLIEIRDALNDEGY